MGKPMDQPPSYTDINLSRMNQPGNAQPYGLVPPAGGLSVTQSSGSSGYPQPSYPQPGYPQPNYPLPQVAAPQIQVHQIVQAPPVGPNPTTVVCPSCHATVQTKIEHEASGKTHLVCCCLCLFQCYLCCLLPYCMNDCQNSNHSCPNCGAYIGTHIGPYPIILFCPVCLTRVRTEVEYVPGCKTHLLAALLCFLGCCPCCLIPYCVNSCQDALHTCPRCGTIIATTSW